MSCLPAEVHFANQPSMPFSLSEHPEAASPSCGPRGALKKDHEGKDALPLPCLCCPFLLNGCGKGKLQMLHGTVLASAPGRRCACHPRGEGIAYGFEPLQRDVDGCWGMFAFYSRWVRTSSCEPCSETSQ